MENYKEIVESLSRSLKREALERYYSDPAHQAAFEQWRTEPRGEPLRRWTPADRQRKEVSK